MFLILREDNKLDNEHSDTVYIAPARDLKRADILDRHIKQSFRSAGSSLVVKPPIYKAQNNDESKKLMMIDSDLGNNNNKKLNEALDEATTTTTTTGPIRSASRTFLGLLTSPFTSSGSTGSSSSSNSSSGSSNRTSRALPPSSERPLVSIV